MQIEKRSVDSLNPAAYNPRKNLKPGDKEYEKIKNSIQYFGYVDPLIVNKDGTIIGGHQRYKVLKELGYSEIDCVVVELGKEDEKALNIALNKICGDWDIEQLGTLLSELRGAGLADITGFDAAEVDALIGNEPVVEDNFNPDDAIPETPITKQGDVWLLGTHKLLCGDSTLKVDIDKLTDGVLVDCIITDPPYNVNYEGEQGMKIKNDNMEDHAFKDFLLQFYKRAFDVAKSGCPIYVFHADTEGLNFRVSMNKSGWEVKQCIIWVKNSLVMGRQDYQWRHEPILYGWKGGSAHKWYGARDKDTVIDQKERLNYKKMSKQELVKLVEEISNNQYENCSVIYHDRPTINDMHPTMKPVRLVGKLMSNSSQKGDIVFDPFGGSGSTLIAAEQLGRRCFTMELDEKYADVIVARYIKFKDSYDDIFVIRDGEKVAYSDLTGGDGYELNAGCKT